MRKRHEKEEIIVLPLIKHNRKIVQKTNGNKELKIYMEAENLFDTYFNKAIIDQDQWEASQMYYEAWFHGVYSPMGVKISKMEIPYPKHTGKPNDPTSFYLDMKEQYYKYIIQTGKRGRIVLDAICYGTLATDLEKEYGWVKRYANERLREALDDLCYYIGLKKEPIVN